MKLNKRNLTTLSLMLGIVFFAIGWATDNTIFSTVAIPFLVIALFLGGRWMRPRRK